MAVLAVVERLREPRQVILHARHDEHPRGAREVAARAHERQVFRERAVPPPPLPGHRPSRATPALYLHSRLVDRPGGHCLSAGFVPRDDGLQDREGEASRGVVFELGRVERELPRAFADRVREIDAEVAGREIDVVRLAHMIRKVARQLALEALEVALQSQPRPTGRTGRGRTGDRGPRDRARERRPARRRRARA